jgi:hypothetical protein
MAPAKAVDLDLDVFEDEGEKPPYKVKLGGTVYELAHPKSMDYRELLELLEIASDKTNVTGLLAMLPKLVTDSDREGFFANKLAPFKLEALMNGYLEHFDIGKVKAGEADASSPS